MATIIITGGTGLIGSALSKVLVEKAHKVIVLTRRAKPSANGVQYKEWDIEKGTLDEQAVAEADYIIHLAGANVADGRWTDQRKKEIVDSRVKSGDLLVKALKEISNNVKAVISASAIGWYGPDPQVPNLAPFTETDGPHDDFLGTACAKWEQSIEPVTQLSKRLVILRTGIVLSNEGGAYAEFQKPLKFGVAGVLGNGNQVVSWIHIDDLVQMYIACVENEKFHGVYNAVAPHPVSNKQLVLAMAKAKAGFRLTLPVPSFALKLALGKMSVEILKSTTVSAQKMQNEGFWFLYSHVGDAVKNLESKPA